MKLDICNLKFLGKNEKEKQYDLCVHGNVLFEIEGTKICPFDEEYCVSVFAYRLLKTLKSNHQGSEEGQMIPCCGHEMIPSMDNTSVNILDCPFGIDFDVIHQAQLILIKYDNIECIIKYDVWRDAVLKIASKVEEFYKTSKPRLFYKQLKEYDVKSFSAFITEWFLLKKEIVIKPIVKLDINNIIDYHLINEVDVLGINKKGIALNSFSFIDFDDCCKISKSNLVGERDITGNPSICFYTSIENISDDKFVGIVFLKKGKIIEFFSRRNAVSRFNSFILKIEEMGYKTRDIS